jgi:hypothetical protein
MKKVTTQVRKQKLIGKSMRTLADLVLSNQLMPEHVERELARVFDLATRYAKEIKTKNEN